MGHSELPAPVTEFDLDKQSVPVPGSDAPGFSHIYQSALHAGLQTTETNYDLFAVGRQKSGDKPCLGYRPWDASIGDFKKEYQWITYNQVEEFRTAIGSAVTKLQKDGKLGDGVGMTNFTCAFWSQNRPEFQIFDQSNYAYSRHTVALYESYDRETASYILDHSEARVCFTTASHLADLLSVSEQTPKLKAIILIETNGPIPVRPGELKTNQLARQWAASKGITLLSWDEALDLGRKNIVAHIPPKDANELSSFCYTSGTTGKPKAAKVSHGELSLCAAGMALFSGLTGEERVLSFLPLAHIFGRLAEATFLRGGWQIGYFNGDVTRLVEDMQILKPTMLFCVPRVLNRIAALISAQMEGPGLKARLLRTAVEAKIANHDRDGSVTHAFYDRVVFRKVRAVLGGNLKTMISGSAPLRPDVLKLLRVAFSIDFREGYGQTENAGYCLCMLPNDKKLGSCGPALPGVQIRLKDCPELGYTANDKPYPRGELLSRGQSVFPGYYKDEEKTKETLDSDGWLHSGDVAQIDEAGRVYIIDRVKNLLKLSQGEYVAIENVEGKLSAVKQLMQLWLYGDSMQSHLVAVAVPEPDTFAPFASNILGQKIAPTDAKAIESACNDEKVTKAILQELMIHGKKIGLKGFEIPRALKLRSEPFSPENGFLTPTQKMKRPEARQKLQKELDALYAQPPAEINNSGKL
ncbi:acetyl-CoA synthetase-like protein [Meira miltonrushii]|uniref:Acetyl-CoA synthetase-like protein n=1 Tax=Meira miltonrushii TaxID=1280837 RepID=A0A316VK12_9BASI|nr:acetyl-CoA synthetase-like protein [Meira miltonrushii]PWN35845.1 acetyl-CoA synthetase-like protein [Meira miltonrushii]